MLRQNILAISLKTESPCRCGKGIILCSFLECEFAFLCGDVTIQYLRSENRESVPSACSVNLTDNIVQALGLGVCIAVVEIVEYLRVPVPDRTDETVIGVTVLVCIRLHPISIQLFRIFSRRSHGFCSVISLSFILLCFARWQGGVTVLPGRFENRQGEEIHLPGWFDSGIRNQVR